MTVAPGAWIRAGLLGLLLCGAAAFAAFGRTGLMRIRQETPDGVTVAAEGAHWPGQSFYSHYPGLSEILVLPANTAFGGPGTVVLHLRAADPDGPDLLAQPLALAAAPPGEWLRFAFPPIDDSAGQVYFFLVEFQGAGPLQLAANGGDMYPEGWLLSAPAGDLVFQAGYRGAVLPTLAVFLERVAAGKPGPFGWPLFYAALALACLAALIGTAWVVTPRLLRPPAAPLHRELRAGPGGEAEAH